MTMAWPSGCVGEMCVINYEWLVGLEGNRCKNAVSIL